MIETIEDVGEFLQEREKLGIKLGLDRIKAMLEYLHHPEKATKMIHVAGTNGKGSTIQLMKDACVANGYDVGLFTSPSFHGVNGHFFMNGDMMSDDFLLTLIQEMLPAIEVLDDANDAPTAFEIITVLSFLYFKQEEVDFAFVETGMGGREDTTNCFDPLLSIITNVEKDHMQFLGETLAEITAHKAGIIKKNRPLVVGPLHDVSKQLLQARAEELHAPLYMFGADFKVEGMIHGSFTWSTTNKKEDISLNLKGIHQVENAAVAWMGLQLLEQAGISLDWYKVKESFATTTIEGRLEQVHADPIILLDSAHNIAAIDKVVATMKELYPQKPIKILFAGFKDKQLAEMIERLTELTSSVSLTTFDHERAAKKADLSAMLKEKKWTYIENWQVCIKDILKEKTDNIWLITGSLHFITMVGKQLKNLSNDN